MITVAAYFTPGYQMVAAATLHNIRRYCDRHGYTLSIFSDVDHPEDDPRPFGFRKTERVLEILRGGSPGDVVCVIDLDLIFTNQTIRLESLLDDEHDIHITEDVNGLNSGIYLIRATMGTQKFLEDVIARAGQHAVHGEQDAMRDSLTIDGFRSLTRIHPQSSFNSYRYDLYEQTRDRRPLPEGNWVPGNFVLHLPGMSNQRRVEIFSSPEIQGAIVE